MYTQHAFKNFICLKSDPIYKKNKSSQFLFIFLCSACYTLFLSSLAENHYNVYTFLISHSCIRLIIQFTFCGTTSNKAIWIFYNVNIALHEYSVFMWMKLDILMYPTLYKELGDDIDIFCYEKNKNKQLRFAVLYVLLYNIGYTSIFNFI